MSDLYSEALKPGYVLGTVTRLQIVPGGDEIFLFSKNVQTVSKAHPASCSVGMGALSAG